MWWMVISPFNDFCGFRSVAVSVMYMYIVNCMQLLYTTTAVAWLGFLPPFFSDFPQDISKTNAATITKFGTPMFHDESRKRIYFGVQRSNVKVWRGCLHSCECRLLPVYIHCHISHCSAANVSLRAAGTVALGEGRRLKTEMWCEATPARHARRRNLVATFIDCISQLVSDWKLIRDARLRLPATLTTSSRRGCGRCWCWRVMTGGVNALTPASIALSSSSVISAEISSEMFLHREPHRCSHTRRTSCEVVVSTMSAELLLPASVAVYREQGDFEKEAQLSQRDLATHCQFEILSTAAQLQP